MREVWDTTWWWSTKTLDMHVSWLRKKLGDDAANPRFITTVRGVGFPLRARVTVAVTSSGSSILSPSWRCCCSACRSRSSRGVAGASSPAGWRWPRRRRRFVAVALAVGVGICGPAVHAADGRARRAGRDARLRAEPGRRCKPSGIAEVDRVAELLDRSADRIDRLIAAERQFASDASHQLRTPLTALSMRLEEIVQADDPRTVREEARSALAQVERLVAVVEHLLDSVRDNNLRAGPVPLDDVVLQQVVEWEPAFGTVNRRIVGHRHPRAGRPRDAQRAVPGAGHPAREQPDRTAAAR